MTSSGAPKPSAAALSNTSSLQIVDLLANGQGVARADKLVVFVTDALPGEQVRVRLANQKANYAVGEALEILKPSPERVVPTCPVFPACGGCQVLHLSYTAQLEWKRRQLQEAFARIGGLREVTVAAAVPSPLIDGTRYRNKVSLVVSASANKPEIGFYAARSHRVVAIRECPVLLPALNDAVKNLIGFFEQHRHWLSDVRHLVLRTTQAHDGLVLSINTTRPQRFDQAIATLRSRIPRLSGIVSSWQPSTANAIFGQRFKTWWGSPWLRESIADTDFTFGVASFFQINTAILECIAQRITSRLADCRRVVDLYCGVGTFGVLLGRRGVSGTGVEAHRDSVDQAAANAARNGVTNVAFECATAEQAVAGARGHSLLSNTGAVIIDPPRRGCAPEVLLALAREGVPRILYLSCNPATLARDAKILADSGYRVGQVEPYDMFPHTGHVESLAEFER